MSALTSPTLAVRIGVVVAALVLATLVEIVTDASVPGRMPLFALGATFLLVLGAKQLARLIQRPLTAEELATEHLPPGHLAPGAGLETSETSETSGMSDLSEVRDA